MRLIKLRGMPFIGIKAGALGVSVAPAEGGRHVDRAERVRKLLLALAFAALGVLLSLVLVSDPAALPRLAQSLPFATLAQVELAPGLSALQALGGSGGIAATWLIARRLRRSLATRRAASMPLADSSAQAALVAAWTSKGSRPVERAGSAVLNEPAYESLPFQPPAAKPAAAMLSELADPAAASDFLNWGRQAARSGDQLVAYRLLMQAVRLDPSSQDAWLWLAGTCDDHDEAIHCLEQVLKLNPENAWARRGLGELLAKDRP